MNSHFFFCLSVAFNRRGNHIKGTDTVRPSSNATVSSSLEQETSTARASLLAIEVGIPSLQEQISILLYDPSNDGQLMTTKPTVRRQVHRIEPEFRITASVRYVDMWWFPIFQTVEEESVPTNPKQYRHCPSLHLCRVDELRIHERIVSQDHRARLGSAQKGAPPVCAPKERDHFITGARPELRPCISGPTRPDWTGALYSARVEIA